jgi:indole-3-glycerol phosphate synthase
MGGCTYADMQTFVEDQRRSRNDVPGPVAVINNNLIIDELQIARTAAYGVSAVVLSLGKDETTKLLNAAKEVDVEAIVAVSSKEEAQQAISIRVRVFSVVNVPGMEDKTRIISDLTISRGTSGGDHRPSQIFSIRPTRG